MLKPPCQLDTITVQVNFKAFSRLAVLNNAIGQGLHFLTLCVPDNFSKCAKRKLPRSAITPEEHLCIFLFDQSIE
ncbi:hypothetical protein D3C80_1687470 [compost metagenome]